jgi:Protein of unknown function (DUF3307)
MTNEAILALMTVLAIKHFVLDFITQTPYQWMNKGTYGHPGGILHSGLHALVTVMLLLFFTSNIALIALIGVFEFIVHYHMDWAKMNLNKRKGWAANTHAEFWVLTGFDQFVHSMTYIVILAILVLV